jgi:hypothetical protein
MTRELTDAQGIAWTCVQAFAGLGGGSDKTQAARVDGSEDRLHVVCTPSGGARSVRLELPDGWEAGLSNDELLGAIRGRLDAAPA